MRESIKIIQRKALGNRKRTEKKQIKKESKTEIIQRNIERTWEEHRQNGIHQSGKKREIRKGEN